MCRTEYQQWFVVEVSYNCSKDDDNKNLVDEMAHLVVCNHIEEPLQMQRQQDKKSAMVGNEFIFKSISLLLDC